MSDVFTRAKRSAIMANIRGKDTAPEKIVRRLLHKNGYRFRLHRKDLPGCPDIVLPKHQAVIFVHGCFWHGHPCRRGKLPASNATFWESKINGNARRDRSAIRRLRSTGWRVLVLWQCEIGKNLERKVTRFIKPAASNKKKKTLSAKKGRGATA